VFIKLNIAPDEPLVVPVLLANEAFVIHGVPPLGTNEAEPSLATGLVASLKVAVTLIALGSPTLTEAVVSEHPFTESVTIHVYDPAASPVATAVV
jgi:hypothetical protein